MMPQLLPQQLLTSSEPNSLHPNSWLQDRWYWYSRYLSRYDCCPSPLFDTATGVALNIGTTNATQINLNKNVSIAANQNITFVAGTGNFDQSASTGTFQTGTGAVSLNGDTTVASGKNLTVTSGTTALTGTTNINTSGAATTSIGTGTGNNSIGNTTGTLGLTGSTVTVAGNTSINTTGTGTTTIGSVTAGAVSITSMLLVASRLIQVTLLLTQQLYCSWALPTPQVYLSVKLLLRPQSRAA
ncbi:hypothetical protein IPL68_04500 [Candidatus Saccharibacteria bacterium]|nr:MAG: hypothetical protein IPL68_04500 [Candidatus Saccharibacteria bacterium]